MRRLDLAGYAMFSRQEPPSSPQELLLPAVASCPRGPPLPQLYALGGQLRGVGLLSKVFVNRHPPGSLPRQAFPARALV